jgi:signal transduction histidine kinase
MDIPRFRLWFRIGTAAYCLLLVWHSIYIWPRLTESRKLGWRVEKRSGSYIVTSADRGSAVRVGDRVIAVEGQSRYLRWLYPQTLLTRLDPPAPYTLTVRRDAETLDLHLRVQAVRAPVDLEVLISVALSLAFFAMGFVFGVRRPDLPVARLGWLAGTLQALISLRSASWTLTEHGWPMPWHQELSGVLSPWANFCAILFLAAFPSSPPETGLWTLLRRVFAAIFGFSWVLTLIALFAYDLPLTWSEHWGAPWPWFRLQYQVDWATILLTAVACTGVMIRNYRRQPSEQDRSKIRLVAFAVCVAAVLRGALAIAILAGWYNENAEWITDLAVLAVPAALAYAVLQRRVVDVGVVIRRGIQYLLARRTIEALILLPASVVYFRAATHPGLRARDLVQPIGLHIGLLCGAVLLLAFRLRILAALDRTFFRGQWDRERILSSLLDAIRLEHSFPQTIELVRQRLDEALHPELLRLICRDTRSGPLLADGRTLAEDRHFLRELTVHKRAVDAERAASASAEDLQWLRSSGAELLVPIPATGEALAGLMLLGPKKSEEAYTAADRSLLEAVAAQLGLAHEIHLLSNERLNAVLEERTRIARDLHDTLAQGFVGIVLHLDAARSALPAAPASAEPHLELAASLARSSLAEARSSVHDLRTGAHATSELTSLLSELCRRLSTESGVRLEVETSGYYPLKEDVSRNLFRIAQESITNALKHAGATRVTATVEFDDSGVLLTVRDNGKGFQLDESSAAGKYGLMGMRERAAQIQAKIEIDSTPGAGTAVRARAPYA